MFRQLAFLPTLVLGAVVLGAPPGAVACDPPACTYKTVVSYEQVTVYQKQRVAYDACFTLYDSCGRPYTVNQVRYREVVVPVTRTVVVSRRVPVCY